MAFKLPPTGKLAQSRHSVYLKTVHDRSSQLAQAVSRYENCWVNWTSEINFLLKEEDDAGKEYALETMLIEAGIDARDSVLAVSHGLYKPAMTTLRSALETSLNALYCYDHEEFFEEGFQRGKYFISVREGPRYLLGKSPFKEFDTKYNLKDELMACFHTLSSYTHNRGQHASPGRVAQDLLSMIGLDDHGFSGSLFDDWYISLVKVTDLVNTCMILAYPEVLTGKEVVPYRRVPEDGPPYIGAHALLSDIRISQLTSVLG